MLAKVFNGRNIEYPCFVQPKLNGVRALWQPDIGKLQSRGLPKEEGKFWLREVLPHIYDELDKISIPLDGELYCHGMSLQQINARVAVNRVAPHKDFADISYNVFDCPMALEFEKRLRFLNDMENYDFKHIRFVETYVINSNSTGDMFHRKFREEGYEGTMYRTMFDQYGFQGNCSNQENRWNYLLKRKDWKEGDGVIIGFEQEMDIHGQLKDSLGALILRLLNGKQVSVGSGLSKFQRVHYWQDYTQALLKGQTCKFKYETLSDGGVPLKPSVLFVDDSVLY